MHMALPETLVNVRPFTSSLIFSPGSQDAGWPRVPWPQEAAEIGYVAWQVVASLSHSVGNGGGGAGSYENLKNFFYPTCYEKTHHMRRETITSL